MWHRPTNIIFQEKRGKLTHQDHKKRAIFVAGALIALFSPFSESLASEPRQIPDSAAVQNRSVQTIDSIPANSKAADSSFRIKQESIFSIMGVVLPHHSLRNSKTLHKWPFFAFAAPSVGSNVKIEKDINKFFTLGGDAAGDLNFARLALHSQLDITLVKLLTLSVRGNIASGWNYGETSTLMGVYNPSKKDYRQDLFLTQFSYGVNYNAKLTIPVMAFLPKSKWTKILLSASGSLDYAAYTGADDGEAWLAGSEVRANGYKMQYGGSLIYILPFKRWNMAMISANVSGFLRDSYFDEAYADYDPDFKTVSITPMAMFRLNDKWTGTFIAVISRDREYEAPTYESSQEILQKRIGSTWGPRIFTFIANRKF